MDPRLKQRLVGAAVLLALAVIFLPMLLDGSGQDAAVSLREPVPPEPEFARPPPAPPLALDSLPEPAPRETQPSPRADARSLPEPDPLPRMVTPPQVVQPEPPTVPGAAGGSEGPGGFAVQVGSFGEQASAGAERDRLEGLGYTVFLEPVRVEGREFFRVKLGPVAERGEAERLRDRVKDQEGVQNAIVVTHP